MEMDTRSKVSEVLPVDERSGLFARQATGLVRNVTGVQSVALNLMGNMPALGVATGVFFGLAGFPGGSFYVAILLTIPLCLAFSYSFGLQSAIMPRSGGDYMIVSRVLTPGLGFVSTSLMMVAQLIAIASLALFTVTLALAPALATVGLVAGNDTLVQWGDTVATSKGWQFGIGAGSILLVGVIVSMGWRYTRKFIMGMLIFALAGLLVAMLVALFTSRSGFVSAFNSFAAPFTGETDTYRNVIAEARKSGVELGGGFSLGDSIAMMGVIATFGFYSWNTAFIAGEVREGSTSKTAHRMALGGILALVTVAVAVAVFFKTWGHDFLAAAFGGAFPAELGPLPAYFFLTSAQVDNTVFAVLMSASFLAVFPVVFATIMTVMPRVIFAWAFDGAFPRAATKVNRYNAPVTATWILAIGAIVVLVWEVFVADSFIQILVYLTLIQLTAMALVGLSAIALPFRRPELYRGSASARTILGVPVMVIAGVGSLLGAGLVYYLYFTYDYYGLANKGEFFLWLGGAILAGCLFYQTAKWVRARQGMDLRLVYSEIPPE
jgi:basic amino acid/polyamine antiporter, APA family